MWSPFTYHLHIHTPHTYTHITHIHTAYTHSTYTLYTTYTYFIHIYHTHIYTPHTLRHAIYTYTHTYTHTHTLPAEFEKRLKNLSPLSVCVLITLLIGDVLPGIPALTCETGGGKREI